MSEPNYQGIEPASGAVVNVSEATSVPAKGVQVTKTTYENPELKSIIGPIGLVTILSLIVFIAMQWIIWYYVNKIPGRSGNDNIKYIWNLALYYAIALIVVFIIDWLIYFFINKDETSIEKKGLGWIIILNLLVVIFGLFINVIIYGRYNEKALGETDTARLSFYLGLMTGMCVFAIIFYIFALFILNSSFVKLFSYGFVKRT